MADKTVRFIIKRQPTPDASPHWEEFDLRWRPGMNVITGLMDISENAVDRFGKPTIPVTYDSNCLEEVCGSCAMLINGRAAMACSALVHKLKQPIRLEPLSRFPVVRDLAVDRSVLFENLKRVKAWVPVDGTYDLGPGPRIDPESQEKAYPLSRCISCCLPGSLSASDTGDGLCRCGNSYTHWRSVHTITWLSSLQDLAARPEWFCSGALRRIGESSASLRQPNICGGSWLDLVLRSCWGKRKNRGCPVPARAWFMVRQC